MTHEEMERELTGTTAYVYWLGTAVRAILAVHPAPASALAAWEEVSAMGVVGWQQSAIARGLPGYRADVMEKTRLAVDGLFRGVPGASPSK